MVSASKYDAPVPPLPAFTPTKPSGAVGWMIAFGNLDRICDQVQPPVKLSRQLLSGRPPQVVNHTPALSLSAFHVSHVPTVDVGTKTSRPRQPALASLPSSSQPIWMAGVWPSTM